MKKNPFLKYENKDPRCDYPFTPDPLGYCWGYANNVDENKTKEECDKYCKGCEMWLAQKKEKTNTDKP